MNCDVLYDGIMQLQAELESQRSDADYREIKALAATYELQEYLSHQIALEAEDDAKFGALMLAYGEWAGQRDIELNERLQADPNAEMPPELDAKCLVAIERVFGD